MCAMLFLNLAITTLTGVCNECLEYEFEILTVTNEMKIRTVTQNIKSYFDEKSHTLVE